jgi:hypothetical protein
MPQTPDNAIAAYLADHMAGSLSAAYLARRGAENNDGLYLSSY